MCVALQHTWADAMVVVRMFYNVIKSINAEVASTGFPVRAVVPASLVPARKLPWKINDELHAMVESASSHMLKLAGTVDLKVLDFPHFGKGLMKRYRLIPDFFVQMAIQLTFYRLHNEVTAVYETGHTRLFYHGRTDTIKAMTVDSLAFVRSMDDAAVSVRGTPFPVLVPFGVPPPSPTEHCVCPCCCRGVSRTRTASTT